MTQFQKLCKGLGFAVIALCHMMLVRLYLLIAELPFVNKRSLSVKLAVKSAYHLVRSAQSVYSMTLLLGDDERIKTAKEFLDQSMSNWFSMV